MMPFRSFSTVMGTCGGTVLATLPVIGSDDLIRTGILALVGAVVSFSVSFSLKIVVKNFFSAQFKSDVRFQKKKDKEEEKRF
ncbi:hypothetical protein EI546_03470 [Aequorivita sp. H23M31]|uniref:Uncharacterized protein n=1 Tax=Aequorivita ciconiae TaxID=2494375 RepID=A0A410G0P6_9FLAO|nr:hypothetical protein [Aequorivita sp. H23M31]QAA80844.1 hypothetical protein EI546_03470 [Aequorivita sp. H23M31]